MAAASLDDKIQSLFLDCEPEFKSYFDKLDQGMSYLTQMQLTVPLEFRQKWKCGQTRVFC